MTLPNLQFLNLSHCKRLEGLSHSTPRLTKLVLSQCPRLTDWDESSVVSRLKLLNIHSCASLENDGELTAWRHPLSKLQNDSDAFRCDCKTAPFLLEVDPSIYIDRLFVTVLKTILARCPGLEGLDANGCQHISSLDFTKHLQLRAVDVSGCHLLRSLKCDSPGLTCLRAKNCLRLLVRHARTALLGWRTGPPSPCLSLETRLFCAGNTSGGAQPPRAGSAELHRAESTSR